MFITTYIRTVSIQLFSCFSYLEQLVDDLCRVGKGGNVKTMGWLQLSQVFADGRGSNLNSAPLHYIAEENSHEMAQILLEYKTDIEARKEENQTCFYVTTSNNNTEVMQLMLGRTKGIKAKDGCIMFEINNWTGFMLKYYASW